MVVWCQTKFHFSLFRRTTYSYGGIHKNKNNYETAQLILIYDFSFIRPDLDGIHKLYWVERFVIVKPSFPIISHTRGWTAYFTYTSSGGMNFYAGNNVTAQSYQWLCLNQTRLHSFMFFLTLEKVTCARWTEIM